MKINISAVERKEKVEAVPEVDGLEANLAMPHPLEPTLLRTLSRRALPPAAPLLVELLPLPLLEGALLEAHATSSAGGAEARSLAEQRARGAEDGVGRRSHRWDCRFFFSLFVREKNPPIGFVVAFSSARWEEEGRDKKERLREERAADR